MRKSFKTLAVLFAAATIAISVASCAKDELSEEAQQSNPGVERTISASATLPPSQGDKAYLDVDNGRKVKWELTDAVNINGTNLALTKVTSTDSTKAIFDGTTYAIHSGSQDIYWVVYPTTLAGAYDGDIPSNFTENQFTFTMPDAQTYDISQTKILEGSTYMAAKVSVPTGETHMVFSMKNLGAVMKIRLSATGVSNTNVERIVFSSDSRLNGEFYFDGRAVTASTADDCNLLTINLTDGTNSYVDISGGVDVYAFLPPISGGRLSMTVYNTDGREMTRTVSNATLAQNTMYTSRFNVTAFSAPFSVSDCKKVLFSPGNLQWSATGGGATATTHATADGLGGPGTWRFAEHQWDCVGDGTNGTVYANGVKCNNNLVGENYTGWIDLFGWGTSGYHNASDASNTNYYPYSSSINEVDETYNYYGYGPSINMTDPSLVGTSAYYDWGVYNYIYNPKTDCTDPAGTWRLPTWLEWDYMVNIRTTASGMRYAKARIDGVNGLIMIPDTWNASVYTLNSANTPGAAYTTNVMTQSQWTILENYGCVFLPASGGRGGTGTTVYDLNSYAGYFSSTYVDYFWAIDLEFYNGGLARHFGRRCYGRPVRLVRPVN